METKSRKKKNCILGGKKEEVRKWHNEEIIERERERGNLKEGIGVLSLLSDTGFVCVW